MALASETSPDLLAHLAGLEIGDPLPVPPEPASEAAIMRQWTGPADAPLVSILCHTFQHAPFLRDALNGFLAQRTDFPFEIIIHDDASTDGTTDIVRSYVAAYPNLIKAIIQPRNIYAQGLRPPHFTFPLARGKYICLCEGDDYWLDQEKLAKQTRFMEHNPDFSVCGHDALKMRDNHLVAHGKISPELKRELSKDELRCPSRRPTVLTLTAMARNVLRDLPPEYGKVRNGDTFLFSLLAQYGKSQFLSDVAPAVYRLHGGGAWSSLNDKDQLAMRLNTFYWMGEYYARIGDQASADFYFHLAARLVTSKARSGHAAEVAAGLYRWAKRHVSGGSPTVYKALRKLKRSLRAN